MTVEAAGFIDDIDPTQPPGTDNFSEGDNHLRNFKKSVQDSFPNISGAMTADEAELSSLDGYTGNTADLNVLAGADAGGLTAAELLYVAGATSDIQTQIDTKETYVQLITGTVAASALTLGLAAGSLNFRNATLTSGAATENVHIALSLVVPSTATLGTTDAVESDLILLAIDNGGTTELAVVNNAGTVSLDEKALISTTAISVTADSADVAYSTTARSDVAFRVVGLIRSTQSTAGTWATSPSLLQTRGGAALSEVSLGALALAEDVTEAEIDWPNNAGITQGCLYRLETNTTQALDTEFTARLYVPASANSIEYEMSMSNSNAPTTDAQGRLTTSTNNGTTVTSSATTETWSSAGTVDSSDKSGWTDINIQLGASTGATTTTFYMLAWRFI